MPPHSIRTARQLAMVLFGLLGLASFTGAAGRPEPVVYTVRFQAPATHVAEIEVVVPARGHSSVELMMALWTPGFYCVEDSTPGEKAPNE